MGEGVAEAALILTRSVSSFPLEFDDIVAVLGIVVVDFEIALAVRVRLRGEGDAEGLAGSHGPRYLPYRPGLAGIMGRRSISALETAVLRRSVFARAAVVAGLR
jgi:hypothetical protein